MGLIDRISRTTQETRDAQFSFISLRSIYAFLRNQDPDASDLDIFRSFCLECNSLDKTLTFYEMVSGRPLPVNSNMITAFQPRFTSFEESGRNLLPDLSSVVRLIEHDPMGHPDAEKYGFLRDEISKALGIDFPSGLLSLRDKHFEEYEKEISELKQKIALLEAQNKLLKPSKGTEVNAVLREDCYSALISLIFHPELYIDASSLKAKYKCSFEPKDFIRNAFGSQTRLVETLNQKSDLFWKENGEPPLSDRIIGELLSKAINRLDQAK